MTLKMLQLTLVGMEALDLNVEDRIHIRLDTGLRGDVASEALLFSFGCSERIEESIVICKGFKAPRLLGVAQPAVADFLGDEPGKRGLAFARKRRGEMPLVLLLNFSGVIA